jgi:para-nitrobenzyl esterase
MMRKTSMALSMAGGLAGAWAISAQAAPTRVDGGRIEGVSQDGVTAYKGVPYAQAPVGALRWTPPKRVKAWSGVRKADALAPACPQTPLPPPALVMSGGDPGPQSEDCLYLNIWAPTAQPAKPAPVMVWLHGGGLRVGSGGVAWYDGAPFARDGVVAVNVNYRLGPLGWFAHPGLTKAAKGAPVGNYGLMDQIAALKWVKRNIARFGGDPRNVTIFGESAGGASVLMLMSSPRAQGLFAKAIVESGGNGRATPLAEAEAAGAKLLGGDLDAKALRALPLDKINTLAGAEASGAIIDGQLLTEAPAKTIAQGGGARVPLIIGSNSGEDSLMAFAKDAVPNTLKAVPDDRLAAVKTAYAGEAADDASLAHALFTDLRMGAPAHAFAAAHAASAPTWFYHFAYVPDGVKALLPKAVHGMELFFVFESLSKSPIKAPISDADKTMADTVHACWVAFAKTSQPDCGLAWPTYDRATDAALVFDRQIGLTSAFRATQYRAIDGLYLGR